MEDACTDLSDNSVALIGWHAAAVPDREGVRAGHADLPRLAAVQRRHPSHLDVRRMTSPHSGLKINFEVQVEVQSSIKLLSFSRYRIFSNQNVCSLMKGFFRLEEVLNLNYIFSYHISLLDPGNSI